MVSPSTHFYWKIGAPRALINKELLPQDTIFKPIKEGFSSYTSQFTYLQGTATSVAAPAGTVTVKKGDSTEDTIHYNSLIICTGTSSNSPLWSLNGEHALSQEALTKMHTLLPHAKSIVIAGGGAVGVETAGEIAAAYPQAKITILSGGSSLLARAPSTSMGKAAEARLKTMSVDVVHNLRAKSREETADKQVKLAMDDGSNRVTDLYLDCTGGKPNTGFVPSDWLDERKLIKVDPDTFRVKGSDNGNVYAVGDAADYSNQTYMYLDAAVAPVCSSLGVDVAKPLEIEKKQSGSSGMFGWLFGSGPALVQKTFKPIKNTMMVPIGRKGGVGSLMGVSAPSTMVWLVKGRTYFVEQVPKIMTGDMRAKA